MDLNEVNIELYFCESATTCQRVHLYVIKNSSNGEIGSEITKIFHSIVVDKNLYLHHTWDGMKEIDNEITLCKITFSIKPYSAIRSFLVEELTKSQKLKNKLQTISVTETMRNLK